MFASKAKINVFFKNFRMEQLQRGLRRDENFFFKKTLISGFEVIMHTRYKGSSINAIFGTWKKLVLRETTLTETMLNQGFTGPKNGINGGLL